MRRFFNGLLVVSFVLSLTTTTAYAAPRRDDGDSYLSPIKKIEKAIGKVIKKVFKQAPNDDMSFPVRDTWRIDRLNSQAVEAIRGMYERPERE